MCNMTESIYKITETVRNYYHIDSKSLFTLETLPATELIVPQRLDVLIKVYYVEAKVKGYNMEFAKELYSKHINSITRFTNSENGQKEKNNIEAFIDVFDKLIESFSKEGFNDVISLIPVSSDGIILDGAHRLACAIYFKKNVSVIRFDHIKQGNTYPPGIYDYNYFKNYLLEQKYLDVAVQTYLRYAPKNIYIACIWPVVGNTEKRDFAIQRIAEKHPVIARKDISLSFFSFDRFVSQVYMHDDWVGNIENNFSGSQGKSKLTFKENSPCSFLLFEGCGKEDTLRLKDEVRAIFNIDKHSVHMTDNTEQTKFIVDIVFNNNSILFLKHANPGKYVRDIRKLYNMNNGAMYGIDASKAVWGLESLKAEDIFLRKETLKDDISLEGLSYIPDTHFYYLGMKMFMPEKNIVQKYLKDVENGTLLSFNYLRSRKFDNIKYKFRILSHNLKSDIYTVVIKYPGLMTLLKKIKKVVNR